MAATISLHNTMAEGIVFSSFERFFNAPQNSKLAKTFKTFYQNRCMISPKYTEDVERCHRIGDYIRGRVREGFKSRREAAERFSGLIGLNPTSAYYTLSNYVKGHFVIGFSSGSDTRTEVLNRSCRRLALVFTMLGVEEGDPTVVLAREVNPRFVYPIHLERPSKILEGVWKGPDLYWKMLNWM